MPTGRWHWWLRLRASSRSLAWSGWALGCSLWRSGATWSLLPLTLFQLESLMSLLPSTEFGRLELFQVELLTFLNQLLTLVFQTFAFAFHRGFQFFEMSQLDLELLHLRFHQQCD